MNPEVKRKAQMKRRLVKPNRNNNRRHDAFIEQSFSSATS
jgi:hypothetical protein